jgi:hypothetical protein
VIEITTLLLGLVAGPRMIEFTAAPQVASVVFEVDGEVTVGARPEDGGGMLLVPLGDQVMPHRVSAVAYDRTGREIGRDDEWINLPRAEIDAELVLHGDPRAPERASLVWEHLAHQPATLESAVVTLDGEPLEAADPTDLRLPRLDPEVPHVLALDVTFSNGERMDLARSFGGGAIDEVETRLLPFQVTAREGAQWPADPVAALDACLEAPRGARVHGWEDEGADVLVVRDIGALGRIDQVVRRRLARRPRSGAWVAGPRALDRYLPLRDGDRLRQVWPVPSRSDHHGLPLNLFPSTLDEDAERGFVSALRERYGEPGAAEQRLTDAVGLAGFLASGSRRPSAVVLVLGEAPRDTSRQTPDAVRAYLDALGVPLHVWSLVGEKETPGWGTAVDVSTYSRLEDAVRALRHRLDRQRLVWLAGVDLPQDVRLAAECGCCRPATSNRRQDADGGVATGLK